jgi:ATP-binding cassette subfamily B protein
LSLHIPSGQFVALVGPNGAGKTTLLKLLCRFYDPEQGGVTWNGVDLRCLSLGQWWETISVLLQQPVHYGATVAENIGLGCWRRADEFAEIESAAQAAGAHEFVGQLPGGYQQPLRKWFQGGTELSVGQWQRLALARVFFRPAQVFVFDEPTSAMDPWAEIAWLRRLRDRTAGKTAIVITHRLTTAMHADVIHVLAEGGVVESGSHAELLQRGGLYAQSWQDQRLFRDRGPGGGYP